MKNLKTRMALLTMASGSLLLYGCETTGMADRDAYNKCINTALGGAVIGAIAGGWEEALVGAAVGGLACVLYQYMSVAQVQQMEAGTDRYLSSGDASGEFEIEGGTVKIQNLEDIDLEEFVTESQLADAGIEDSSTCRMYTSEVSLESGTNLGIEGAKCLNAEGDFITVKSSAKTVA